MKNLATDLDPRWTEALRLFDEDLRRRSSAEKTRRAYGIDCGQFAQWATARAMSPEEVDVRSLRRFAASLSESGLAARTVARKLAALRALLRVLRDHGWI